LYQSLTVGQAIIFCEVKLIWKLLINLWN
jgi:hypothetical protein